MNKFTKETIYTFIDRTKWLYLINKLKNNYKWIPGQDNTDYERILLNKLNDAYSELLRMAIVYPLLDKQRVVSLLYTISVGQAETFLVDIVAEEFLNSSLDV